jgi:hypothetical protein
MGGKPGENFENISSILEKYETSRAGIIILDF